MRLRIYFAGKVSGSRQTKKLNWRDQLCAELSKRTGLQLINLDPLRTQQKLRLDQNDPQMIYGVDSYLIAAADLVIVNLTDDISVGGSQEMLIAKYFSKPLIGYLSKQGKFYDQEKKWIHPFVAVTCDQLAFNLAQLARAVKTVAKSESVQSKDLTIVSQALRYFTEKKSLPFKNFKLNFAPKVYSAVKALINRGSRFLVVKQQVQDKYYWDLPGGIVKFGENPLRALVRESKEEVGLKINVQGQLGAWSFFRRDGDQVVCTTFNCQAKNFEVDIANNPEAPTEKIVEYAWVTKKQFLSKKFGVYDQSLKALLRQKVLA